VADFAETLFFSAIMGFSIYLSLPVVFHRRRDETTTKLLVAVAIGILIFLMADVFSDVTPTLYGASSFYGYGSSPFYDLVFMVSLAAGFLTLYCFENRSKESLTPTQLSLIIALGIGFQNLTEGLVFGALGVALGLTGVTLVVLVGFTFQNITEGFPIASPFLGKVETKTGILLGLFFIGGLPTVIGGATGFFYSSTVFDVIFDGVAIGSILYVILPMLKNLFKESGGASQRVIYMGIFLGFVLGSLVNMI
jgi:ZIP family zinc transporter